MRIYTDVKVTKINSQINARRELRNISRFSFVTLKTN